MLDEELEREIEQIRSRRAEIAEMNKVLDEMERRIYNLEKLLATKGEDQ
jgi:hypothetical protein